MVAGPVELEHMTMMQLVLKYGLSHPKPKPFYLLSSTMSEIPQQLSQQHTPAVKVGGRRLSAASKPKHRPAERTIELEEEDPLQTIKPPEHKFDDYPRPTGGETEEEHERHRYHDEPPKKDKKTSVHEKDLKSQKLMEATMPSKDHSSKADHGRRINQPSKTMV